jgi:hypothetical protein
MKDYISKIIGSIMLATPFVFLIASSVYALGVWNAIMLWSSVIFLFGWIVIAVHLLIKD